MTCWHQLSITMSCDHHFYFLQTSYRTSIAASQKLQKICFILLCEFILQNTPKILNSLAVLVIALIIYGSFFEALKVQFFWSANCQVQIPIVKYIKYNTFWNLEESFGKALKLKSNAILQYPVQIFLNKKQLVIFSDLNLSPVRYKLLFQCLIPWLIINNKIQTTFLH